MMNKDNHPFHIVDFSPWPLIIRLSAFSLFSSIIGLINFQEIKFLLLNFITITLISFLWWRDVGRESKLQGLHLNPIIDGLKIGILLFIVSEILFFISFFWAFFHVSLSPNLEIGSLWPPHPILPFSYWEIPLLNTIILLISGITVTWSHTSILYGKKLEAKINLFLSSLLGLYFASLQALEYVEASYTFTDSTYGSSFFIATGFHGIHIIVGTLFLITTYFRMLSNRFRTFHHMGFEAAAWYWHFVDVVWLFLFTFIYWWVII